MQAPILLLTRCVLVNFPQLDPSAVPGDEDSQMTALLVAGLFFQLRATKYLNSKTPAPGVTGQEELWLCPAASSPSFRYSG